MDKTNRELLSIKDTALIPHLEGLTSVKEDETQQLVEYFSVSSF